MLNIWLGFNIENVEIFYNIFNNSSITIVKINLGYTKQPRMKLFTSEYMSEFVRSVI